MNYYNYFATVISLSVLLGYLNNRYIKMQATAAIMAGSILLSLLVISACLYCRCPLLGIRLLCNLVCHATIQ